MLKFIFWSLLLANAGLFAYQQGYLNAWLPDGHEPTRMDHQFHPELIKTVAAGDATAAPATEPPKTTTPTTPAATTTNTGKGEALVCKEIGSFDSTSAKRFETLLQPLALGDKITRKDNEDVANNIVYIPSQGSKEGADKKAGELRHLGINDFYVIQDAGDLHWGISLGVFKTEEAARAFLTTLNQKGVHSARLGTHSIATSKVTFQLNGLDSAAVAGVEKIVADFPHVESHACEGTATADVKTAASHAAVVKPSVPREVTH